MIVTIHVPGEPATKGSTRSFVNPKTGKVVTLGANKRTPVYESHIALAAAELWKCKPCTGKVRVSIRFWLKHSKSHYRTGRNNHLLKRSAPLVHTTKPDIDKLARAVLDGLTGVVFVDDAQVVELLAEKLYGGKPRTSITVEA